MPATSAISNISLRPFSRNMTERLAVLGAGAWGTAVAILLAQKTEHRIALWIAREESARAIVPTRENRLLLPGVLIPETVELTTDIDKAARDARLYITAI